MNIYLISQTIVEGYDSYDSAVVVAETEDDARSIHPSEFVTHVTDGVWMGTYKGGKSIGEEYKFHSYSWPTYSGIEDVKVEYLGKTIKERKRLRENLKRAWRYISVI